MPVLQMPVYLKTRIYTYRLNAELLVHSEVNANELGFRYYFINVLNDLRHFMTKLNH